MTASLAVRVRGSGRLVGNQVERAATFPARLRGLLGRAGLPEGGGLLLEGCASVHTCFMRFPVDLCFLGGERVVRVVAALGPWRAAAALGASAVLELPAGTLARAGVREGDELEIFPCG